MYRQHLMDPIEELRRINHGIAYSPPSLSHVHRPRLSIVIVVKRMGADRVSNIEI
jgi:hypothetical protein